jgi:hypothetical protein
VVARLQRSIDPVTRRLGWTTLRLRDLVEIEGLEVRRRWKTSQRSIFTIVEARNRKREARWAPAEDASKVAMQSASC